MGCRSDCGCCCDCACGESGPQGPPGSAGAAGARGLQGLPGPGGITGATGATGSTGATGAAGVSSGSSIIPFASGTTPVSLTHVLGGQSDSGSVIGFGASAPNVNFAGGTTIDISGADGFHLNMSWSMPRAGTARQLSVFFSNLDEQALAQSISLHVQLYRSAAPGTNIFSPIAGTDIVIPLGSAVAVGQFFNATLAFVVPLVNEDRILLAARVEPTSVDVATTVTGYLSAGLTIE